MLQPVGNTPLVNPSPLQAENLPLDFLDLNIYGMGGQKPHLQKQPPLLRLRPLAISSLFNPFTKMQVELEFNTRKSSIRWDGVTELWVYGGKHNVPHCPKLKELYVYGAELVMPGPLNLSDLRVGDGGKVSGMWHSHNRMGWWLNRLTFWINDGRLMACTGCFNGTVRELLDPKAWRHKPTDDHPRRWLADYRRAAQQAERDFRAAGYQFTV